MLASGGHLVRVLYPAMHRRALCSYLDILYLKALHVEIIQPQQSDSITHFKPYMPGFRSSSSRRGTALVKLACQGSVCGQHAQNADRFRQVQNHSPKLII
jgi:hypothetical protein